MLISLSIRVGASNENDVKTKTNVTFDYGVFFDIKLFNSKKNIFNAKQKRSVVRQ